MLVFGKRAKVLVYGSVASFFLLLAGNANASTVIHCFDNGKKCTARVESGKVNDKVTILNKEKTVAIGKIHKKSGVSTIIKLTKTFDEIKRGYTVKVENETESSNLEWAATFSYEDE